MAAGSANLLELVVRAVTAGVEAALDGVEKSVGSLATSVTAASKKTDQAFKAMEARGEALAAKFEGTMGAAVGAIEALGVAAAGALVAGLGAATKATNDFVEKLADIKTLGVADDELAKYHDALLGIADATSVSLIDLTGGLYDTIKAGVRDTAVATELLNTAQKASVAIGGDVKTNVSLLTTALATFGANATTAAEKTEFLRTAADKLNAIVDSGKFEVEDFAAFLGKVAPVAADAGLSLDQVGASLTTLAAAGLAPKQAFAAFEALLEKLVNPTEATAKAAEKLGFAIGEDALKGKDFRDVLVELNAATGGTVTGLDAVLGDMSAVKAALVLTGGDLGKFDEGLRAVGDSAGSLDADFEEMEKQISARLGRLRNVVVDQLIPAIEKDLLPRVGDALKELASFFEKNGAEIASVLGTVVKTLLALGTWFADHAGLIEAAIAAIFVTKGIDLFLGGLVSVTKTIGSMGDAFSVLKGLATGAFTELNGGVLSATEKVGAFAGSMSALGPVIAAVGVAIIAVGIKLFDFWEEADKRVAKLAAEMREEAAKAKGKIEAETAGDIAAITGAFAKSFADATAREVGAIKSHEDEIKTLRGIYEDLGRSRDKIAAKGDDDSKDELALIASRRKAILDEISDRERAITELSGTVRKLEEKELADSEAGDHKKVASKTRSLAAVKGLLHEESEAEKKLAEERKKRADERLKGELENLKEIVAAELEAAQQISSGLGPQVIPLTVEVDTGAAREAAEAVSDGIAQGVARGISKGVADGARGTEVDQVGEDVGDALQDGAQKGMKRGLEGSAVAAAIAKVAAKLGAVVGQAAKFFGDQLLSGAQAVGDFFLNLFVTGPISEFMNLLKLAASTPAQGTVNAETGAVDVQGFADVLDETLQGFIDTITQFVSNLPTLLRALIPFIGELVNTFVAAVPQIIAAFADNIGPIVQSIIESIGQLADTFTQNIDHFVGLLMDAVTNLLPGLVSALIDLVVSSLNSDVANSLFGIVLNVIQQLVQAIIDLLPNIVTFILDTAGTMGAGVVDFILKLVQSVIDAIPDILDAFVEGLPGFITDLVGGIVGSLIDNLPGIVISLVDLMIFQLPRIVVELIQAIVVAVVDLVKDIGTRIADAFREGVHVDDIGKLIGRAFLAAITFGISEAVRHHRRQFTEERTNASQYDTAVRDWEARSAGQDAAWVAENPPPDPADYAHTGGVVGPTMGDRVQRFRFGGVVRAAQSSFTRRAADEVPIMAQPGEAVLNRAATARVGAAAVHEMNAGGAGGGPTYVIQQLNVDPYRSLDSQVSRLLEKGAGRTGAWDRRTRGAPIRRPTRFGLA